MTKRIAGCGGSTHGGLPVDVDRTQSLLREAREQNGRIRQLIETTGRIVARSRELLARLSGRLSKD
jgi:hypothetical protein